VKLVNASENKEGVIVMLICLSSGDRPRYRQDVLRALALPRESTLQFRYDQRWVSDGVLRMIQDHKIVGQEVLIAYADQSRPASSITPIGAVELIPIRLARVTSASAPGRTVSLTFAVDKIVYSSNLKAFNNEVPKLTGNSLPQWVDGSLKGSYCTELTKRPANLIEAEDLSQWEEVVTQLAARRDFENEETFFTVVGLLTESELNAMSAKIRHVSWPRELPAYASRVLVLYHYHPTKSPTSLEISIRVGSELKLQSPAKVQLDSRYDLKKFQMQSEDPSLGGQLSWIILSTEDPATTKRFELEISVSIRGNRLKRYFIATAIALGLTGAQIVPLVTREDLTPVTILVSALIILVISFTVGFTVVWGIRRSI
jgi:hypothetical protein